MIRLSETHLLPRPRRVTDHEGVWATPRRGTVLIEQGEARVAWAAGGLTDLLSATVGGAWMASAGAGEAEIEAVLDPAAVKEVQGYRLTIKPDELVLLAADAAGMQYGLLTLTQIVAECGADLPCGQIEDAPDFPVRGVMLDVSRDRVPTPETLFEIVDLLAGLKVNHLQLYLEHTFAYSRHREVWAAASPLTGEDILELDAYCRDRGVELTPNQNGFGHMERWLAHPRYAPLSETWGHRDLVQTSFSPSASGRTLCPVDPGGEALVAELYEELLPHFTSPRFNIGGDEPFELGTGRSREACEANGRGHVYTDFLLKLIGHARRLGKTPLYWGDVLMHHPDQLDRLPKDDAVALEWGYAHDHDFDGRCARYAAAGVPFWVCPGAGGWLSIVGRTDRATANMIRAAADGLKHAAVGYLNTDWGDAGHHQPPALAFGPYAVGAAASWCVRTNGQPDWTAIGLHVFEDDDGQAGRLLADVGRLNAIAGGEIGSNAVPRLLILPQRSTDVDAAVLAADRLEAALAASEELTEQLAEANVGRPDAEQIVAETAVAIDLFAHGCRAALRRLHDRGPSWRQLHTELTDLIGRYCAAWLGRSRPGGLADSAGRLEARRCEYLQRDMDEQNPV